MLKWSAWYGICTKFPVTNLGSLMPCSGVSPFGKYFFPLIKTLWGQQWVLHETTLSFFTASLSLSLSLSSQFKYSLNWVFFGPLSISIAFLSSRHRAVREHSHEFCIVPLFHSLLLHFLFSTQVQHALGTLQISKKRKKEKKKPDFFQLKIVDDFEQWNCPADMGYTPKVAIPNWRSLMPRSRLSLLNQHRFPLTKTGNSTRTVLLHPFIFRKLS